MRDTFKTIAVLVAVAAAVSVTRARANDTNYWTQQYGMRAELLLGTVVGSLVDLSALYYNPGTLPLQDNPSLVVGTQAFNYQSIELRDSEGIESPLQTRRFGPAPTLFAGILPPKWLDGNIGYSFLTRSDFDFRIQSLTPELPTADLPDGLTKLGGEVYIDQDQTGVWGGLTWARARGEMGAGATAFVAYHGQRTRNQVLLQGLNSSGGGANVTLIDAINYWHVRLVFKLGVAWDYSPLTFGIAFTAPGIGLFGHGSSLVDLFANGFDLDGDGTPDTDLIANSVADVPTDYRSPGSISGGFSYRRRNTTVHFTTEYFGGVDRYEVMETVTFESPTTGQTYEHKMILELDDVLNWGVGVEQHLRPWLKGYASFITDRTAAVDDAAATINVSTWDLYHLMAGVGFRFIGNDITLGVGYSWGEDKLSRQRSSLTSSRGLVLPVELTDVTLRFTQWKFILGFGFGSGADNPDH